ncbi:MAG: CPBP family intramembrane metalloprotease [Lewinellaceae bacterium]|nr:CPBP family intramembrane metalloprotease [Saprospiraceae bacterium]MCB9330688.1 CPBP family intramembrane metalloprotease [Lewinellaceae bacterium]
MPLVRTNLEADYAIALTTVGFFIFWFTGKSERILAKFVERYGAEKGQERFIYLKRVVGMLCFGVIPALVLMTQDFYIKTLPEFFTGTWADYGVAAKFPPALFYWTIGLGAVITFMTSRTARQPDNLAQYPEIRKLPWSRSTLIWSALTWAGYLVAYEMLFRGFLLFSCVRAYGEMSAIVINTAIYALVHLPKGPKESIGAIPLGALFCYITLQTETIWVAVLVHLALAWSNEWFSLKYRLLEQRAGL